MRKTFVILTLALAGLCSCGGDSGLKSLVEEGVKLDCRNRELKEKENAGDMAAAHERDNIKTELKALREKFSEKYKNRMDDPDFQKKVAGYDEAARMKYCPGGKK